MSLIFVTLLYVCTSIVASADTAPHAVGQTIRWSGKGWWQVQDRTDYSEVCSGNIEEINSCAVGKAGGPFKVTNHSTGQKWTVDVETASSFRAYAPIIRKAEYYNQARIVKLSLYVYPSMRGKGKGVNVYRNDKYITTVRTDTLDIVDTVSTFHVNLTYKDPGGQPTDSYYAIGFFNGFSGDYYSKKSRSIVATFNKDHWFPSLYYNYALGKLRGRFKGSHLSTSTIKMIENQGALAFGGRPDLVSKWLSDAGEIQDLEAVEHLTDGDFLGAVQCYLDGGQTIMYLADDTSDLTVVHELAHVIDCERSAEKTDGIPSGITSLEKRVLVSERNRLFALHSSGLTPTWLRAYTFKNDTEFWADVSSYFLVKKSQRIQMALNAPKLYDMLRSYYRKNHWVMAAVIKEQN